MEWKTVKLGEVCKIFGRIGFRGYTNNDFVTKPEDGAITLSPTNIVDGELDLTKCAYINWDKYYESPEIMVQENDILLSKTGTIGRTALVKRVKHPMTINPQFVLLKECTINPRYLSYLLKTPKFQGDLYSITVGSVIATLSQKNLGNIKIDIVDSATQDKIVAILSSLDDKIENNNRINRNLEEQAQALFKSWFVDFEPWGGTMPEDWREYQLTEFAEIISGYSYKGAELLPSEDAMATIKNFDRKGYFKLDGYKEIQISGRLKNTQILNLFDVIVAHTDITQQADIIGNPAIILSKGGYRNIIMSMDLCKVQPTHYAISSAFLYCLLKDIRFKSHALGYVNGTTVLHMSKKALPEYRVFLPNDLSKVQELGDRLQNLYKRYSINLEESARLAALRDTLLPKLMRGEITL